MKDETSLAEFIANIIVFTVVAIALIAPFILFGYLVGYLFGGK
jgi:hypothetical protein